jgi:hypothetical protein
MVPRIWCLVHDIERLPTQEHQPSEHHLMSSNFMQWQISARELAPQCS